MFLEGFRLPLPSVLIPVIIYGGGPDILQQVFLHLLQGDANGHKLLQSKRPGDGSVQAGGFPDIKDFQHRTRQGVQTIIDAGQILVGQGSVAGFFQ